MFDKIIAYSIKQKFVIGMLVLSLIAIGSYSLKNLPIDALPDITNNQVQIITTAPNLATQEVELFITYPIELAIKAIPEIVELRSVSRFGLSLVTVVFEESTDIYWARSQITERLKVAENEIPKSFGTPELAPISTGLGEIFQYTIIPDEGYEDKFSIMDLRSIQDWIIVPQLLGTQGVAEVNTLGGILKEYEVAVNPDRLKSMNVTMTEIFDALERNNENTGGAYIDKKPYAYFVRSIGMVNSLEDISKIVVKVTNDIPILIRDLAEVRFGNSVRYGATTKDGKGEVVNGMVMMLKGENSAKIVALVKEKLEQVKNTLPEGISIEPYLDRSKLVNKAISTVRTNLIEGALIVIFILVLLIGNWRAGLIVASVIPLALLFAVSMMRLFGVSGNLMSLGAIDFGLIVDGAVIIVESIVHRLQSNKSTTQLTKVGMDEEVYQASSKIRSSAAFGEIIILIVYLPILALVGIEGKMFTPMAQTVAFAILGAFILSLTYVPMMSALCLKRTLGHKENLSDKIIATMQKAYDPVLAFALRNKAFILLSSVLVFFFSIWTFSKLGGEFIPTLSEGDIATHVMIPTGSSLEQEIATTTKAEKLLLENFPEIKQIVSKIGSAEVPTDPMPMEVADVMIILKDKEEWTSASSKQEMFEKMEEVLDALPGVTTEFSQPIQMRFNELMTGVRSDVGIKVFGDDIERLVAYGDEIEHLVEEINGVEDARAESVSGFPQITIKYDKDKLALYGLNVSDLNDIVSMGFAGKKAGVVYEEERKYNLVVRLKKDYREDISSVLNLYISLPSGNQIPLEQVADIAYEKSPAQISREEGKRRVVIGFNVRGRDVESVVSEIKGKIENQIDLPAGYYINYSGQFENLQKAKSRLMIAVPIALLLIFVLLFITFNSIKQSLLIFTAIPLSAIGGVFALWMRSMPFSISAGIGFIALFGVAVLNGIVLISYFNQLKSEGMTGIIDRILVGTKVRLRPVIMTASVASLGFLPMALSTSAGAEVQKPLATVVIGGLITATLLTLIVLPILYYLMESRDKNTFKNMSKVLALGLMSTIGFNLNAQVNVNSCEDAIKLGLENSHMIKANELEIQKYDRLKSGAYIMPLLEIEATVGQINTASIDHSYSFSQSFNPYLSQAKKQLVKEQIGKAEAQLTLAKQEMVLEIRTLWNDHAYHSAKAKVIENQRKMYDDFATQAEKKYDYGVSNVLEQNQAGLLRDRIMMNQEALAISQKSIHSSIENLLKQDVEIIEPTFGVDTWSPDDLENDFESNPLVESMLQEIKIANQELNVLKAELKPQFLAGYFIQSLKGEQLVDGTVNNYNGLPQFHGVNLGIGIPVFGKGRKSVKESKKYESLIAEEQMEYLKQTLNNELVRLQNHFIMNKNKLNYYQDKAIPIVNKMLEDSKRMYELGDVGYIEFMQILNLKYETELTYLEVIKDHNEVVYQIQFLINKG